MTDYKKWDHLDVSDDEDGDDAEDIKRRHADAVDAKRRDDLRTDVEKAISRRAPNADAAVVAAFVSQQTKDADAADNRGRHVHVIEALAHRPALQEEATTRALCRLAREAADTGDVAKGKLYLEALNTLEACRRFGGALSLFERICAPADDVSKELRRLYCKGPLRGRRRVDGVGHRLARWLIWFAWQWATAPQKWAKNRDASCSTNWSHRSRCFINSPPAHTSVST